MTQKCFNVNGNLITAGTVVENQIPNVPVGFYSAGFSESVGYFLEKADSFTLPDKIYGNEQDKIDRIFRTYKRRGGNTGVLLEGVKGSGKTIMAKMLCNQAVELGLPVVIINRPLMGEDFNRFIEQIGPCVLMIDEFEKTYNQKQMPGIQDKLLTLFDGTISTNCLIVMTINDPYEVGHHFYGRPGRIYLRYNFGKLARGIVEEVLAAEEVDAENTQLIMNYYTLQPHFTFDILMSLIEEVKYESEFSTFENMIDPLNLTDNNSSSRRVKLHITHESFSGVEINIQSHELTGTGQNMLQIDFYNMRKRLSTLNYPSNSFPNNLKLVKDADKEEEGLSAEEVALAETKGKFRSFLMDKEHEESWLSLSFDDVSDLNGEDGTFVFTKDGFTVVATPMVTKHMSASRFFGK